MLVDCLGARLVIVGDDFHFGHQRRGNVALLADDGRRPRLRGRGPRPRRRRRRRGRRPADGVVDRHPARARGRRPRRAPTPCSAAPTRCAAWSSTATSRGRELGFPTANVAVPGDILLPADGIYAGWYERPDGARPPGGASRSAAGRRSTTRPTPACSRPTSSTSTATSTASRPGALRRAPARRGEVRRRRRARRADPARLRRGPSDPAGVDLRLTTCRGRVARSARLVAMDDGWDPIAVRIEDDDEHPSGPRPSKVRHLALAESRSSGPASSPTRRSTSPCRGWPGTSHPGRRPPVGVAVCGQGVPLVLVHGFSAEGILYAQTLSRLVDLGFKVVAIDTAGHGGTLGLPTGAPEPGQLRRAARPGARRPRHRRAVLAGHSWAAASSPSWPPPSPTGRSR